MRKVEVFKIDKDYLSGEKKPLKPAKKPLKLNKKIFASFSLAVAVICFMCFGLFFLTDQNLYKIDLNSLYNDYDTGQNIIEMWNVETFEGGSGSRTDFLQNMAIQFNKKNTGKYIVVKSLTAAQAALNIQNGYLPNLVSFGVGAGSLFEDCLNKIDDTGEVRNDLLQYGQIDGVQYALPFILGGYTIISRESYLTKAKIDPGDILQNLYNAKFTSGKKFTPAVGTANSSCSNAYEALAANNILGALPDSFYENNLTNFEMYTNFVNGAFTSLIGTTRDLIRCKNRESAGTLQNCVYNYLGGYSDLVQYLGEVNIGSAGDQELADEFLHYLISENVQKQIAGIGMFSVLPSAIYSEGYLKDFEQVLLQPLKSVSAFITQQQIEGNMQDSRAKLN